MNDTTPQPSVREMMELHRKKLLEQLAAVDREIAAYDRYQSDLAARYQSGSFSMARAVASVPVRLSPPGLFDSSTIGITLAELIDMYLTRADSPYTKLKHNSKQLYDSLFKLIREEYGEIRLADITGEMFDDWHAAWSAGGKVSIAHSKVTMLRLLFGFGISVLNDQESGRLFGILSKRRYDKPKAREQFLTLEQANLIRVKAHEFKRPSIALAQAFQSGVGMLQMDVIGQYVPLDEPGDSDVVLSGGLKWVRGLRWEEIDENLRLRHAGHEMIDIDLTDVPMVLDELELQFAFIPKRHARAKLPPRGPVIRSEYGGNLPWTPAEYRRWWRRIADACNIPKTIRNRDSRKASEVREVKK